MNGTGPDMVPCPVCFGSKASPFCSDRKCSCCGGAGTISAARDAVLARIRRDVTARLGLAERQRDEALAQALSSSLQVPQKDGGDAK